MQGICYKEINYSVSPLYKVVIIMQTQQGRYIFESNFHTTEKKSKKPLPLLPAL